MKILKIIIEFFKKKLKMKEKIIVGRQYRLVETPCGKNSSHNNNYIKGRTTIVEVTGQSSNAVYNIRVISMDGVPRCETSSGWVYDYELESISTNAESIAESIEYLEKEKEEIDSNISILKTKLEFLTTQNIKDFNEEEFKAYLVLKELGIDDFAKAKNIVKILGK